MNSALKWFSRVESDTETLAEDERSEATLEASELPPHVQEFLALKSAAGF